MKIQELSLCNYRSYPSYYHCFSNDQKISVLHGKNGTGKTSLITAIQQGLTGDIQKSDIRRGEVSASITLNVEDRNGTSCSIERSAKITGTGTLSKTTKIDGNKTKKKDTNELLNRLLPISIEDFKVISSSDLVMSMRPADFNNFIFQYIPDRITLDKLLSLEPMSDEVKNLIIGIKNRFEEDEITATSIEKWCNALKDENRMIKQSIQTLKTAISSYQKPETLLSMEEINKKLEQITKDEVQFKSAKSQEKSIKELQKRKEELLIRIQKATPSASPYSSKEYLRYINQLRDLFSGYKNQYEMNKQSIRQFTDYQDRLKSGVCPLSKKITCTVDMQPLIQMLDKNIRQLEQQSLEINRKAAGVIKKIRGCEANYQKTLEEEKQQEILKKEKEELQSIERTQATMLPSKEVQEYDFQEERDKYLNEKTKLNEYLTNEKQLQELQKNENSKKVHLAAIKFLAPDGVAMDYITEYYLGLFNGTIKKRESMFQTNLSVSFVMDQGIRYRITKKNDPNVELNYDQLSSGEKKVVSLMILDLLNLLSGAKILMLDDLDQLDSHNFAEIMKLITNPEFLEAYDHIFLAFVDHPDLCKIVENYSVDYCF